MDYRRAWECSQHDAQKESARASLEVAGQYHPNEVDFNRRRQSRESARPSLEVQHGGVMGPPATTSLPTAGDWTSSFENASWRVLPNPQPTAGRGFGPPAPRPPPPSEPLSAAPDPLWQQGLAALHISETRTSPPSSPGALFSHKSGTPSSRGRAQELPAEVVEQGTLELDLEVARNEAAVLAQKASRYKARLRAALEGKDKAEGMARALQDHNRALLGRMTQMEGLFQSMQADSAHLSRERITLSSETDALAEALDKTSQQLVAVSQRLERLTGEHLALRRAHEVVLGEHDAMLDRLLDLSAIPPGVTRRRQSHDGDARERERESRERASADREGRESAETRESREATAPKGGSHGSEAPGRPPRPSVENTRATQPGDA